jgi:hypothetical protein
MRAFHIGGKFLDALRSVTAKRLAEPELRFTCEDCDRSKRCGRPPSADCIVKLAQIERDPFGHRRRMKAQVAFLKSGYWA